MGKQKELGLLAGAPTARHLLQTLGTAWGRERIHPRLWIELWEDRVQTLLAQGRPVVCDDLRTQEELAAIKALGGQVWVVERPQGAINDRATVAHATEGALAQAQFDLVLRNGGPKAAFEALVLEAVVRCCRGTGSAIQASWSLGSASRLRHAWRIGCRWSSKRRWRRRYPRCAPAINPCTLPRPRWRRAWSTSWI